MDVVIDFLTHRLMAFLTTVLTIVLGTIVTKGWLDADRASALTQAITAAVGAVAATGLHHLVVAPFFVSLQSTLKKWTGGDSSGGGSTAVKGLILMAILVPLFLGGCANQSVQQDQQTLLISETGVTAAAIALDQLELQGKISQSSATQLNALLASWQQANKAWYAAQQTGQTTSTQELLNAALAAEQAYLDALNTAKVAPTTQASGG